MTAVEFSVVSQESAVVKMEDRKRPAADSNESAPPSKKQATTVNGVFPDIVNGASWYDWYTGEKVQAEAGVNTTIPAPLGHIPVYIRGGAVLPTQEPGYTTTESRKNPWGLIVALAEDGCASGSLYVDDGESIEPESTLEVFFTAQNGQLKADIFL